MNVSDQDRKWQIVEGGVARKLNPMEIVEEVRMEGIAATRAQIVELMVKVKRLERVEVHKAGADVAYRTSYPGRKGGYRKDTNNKGMAGKRATGMVRSGMIYPV